MNSIRFITTKTIILITILVVITVIGETYYFNIKSHHSLYHNALLMLSSLSIALFISIASGLYYGIKLKDNIGNLTDHIDSKKLPDFGGGVPDISTAMEGLGGIAEGLGGFLFAILAAFVLILLAWFFILSSWFLIIFLSAILYWVYFRALRLVFKHSAFCKGNIRSSMKYGLIYSFFYTSWAFAIIFTLHFFVK